MPQVIDFKYYHDSANRLSIRRSELRSKYNLGDRRVICFVGQLIERKGLLVLIETLARLKVLNPDVTLLIAGIGPLEKEAQRRCKDLNLDKMNVRFLGYVPQSKLTEVYAVSDIFVLPSYYDTFGAVVLEAMASGLPVVVTEGVGAAYDLVEDGVNGRVVSVGSVGSLGEALHELLIYPELRKKMSEASKKVLEDWNINRAVQGFCSAIEKVEG